MGRRGPKPGHKVGGRQKGTPNRVTGEVKEMVLEALSAAGGVDYLVRQSDENPTAFLTLVGKVLPLQVTGDKSNPVYTHETTTVDTSGLDTAQLRALASIKLHSG